MRLPPLNALRAFEAAARHQSFVRAADELHVTQGAVSRHVKSLEQQLGIVLFQRRAQGVELTPQGRALLPELSASFERIARAAQQATEDGRELRVGCAPTLASRWLVRRLSRFLDRHPEARVTVGLICTHEDFQRGSYDLGITDFETDRKRPEALEAVLLRRERLAPVCAPALLKGQRALRRPDDLGRYQLLHPTPDRLDWRKWLRAAGLPEAQSDGGLVFQSLQMATSAAQGGLGVAIADLDLIGEELSSAALAVPFDFVLREDTGYFVFAERGRFTEPKVARFLHWLLAEAAAA
jgi:LysR family glycine cleavage system transcriptional activator